MITFTVTTITLVSNIIFVFGLVLLFISKEFRFWVYKFVNSYIIILLFIFSLSATLGSLAFSNIIGFEPCELCWIQRIFLFPQVVLTSVALYMKDKNIIYYILPLSILGAIVSFYQSLIHWGFNTSVFGCTSTGGSCAKVYVLEYGYITIPFMALSVFIYLSVLSIIHYKSQKI